jgi:Rod binding domain-containing protein
MDVAALDSTASVPVAAVDRARAAGLRGAALRSASPAAQRVAVASQFEAILVRQLLGPTMTKVLGSEGASANVYGDLLTEVVANQLTAGPGLGLGRIIEQQLTPRGQPVETPPADAPATPAAPPS